MVKAADAARRSEADDQDMPDPGSDPPWDEELTRLIQQGLDREAAELASSQLTPRAHEDPMDPGEQLDQPPA